MIYEISLENVDIDEYIKNVGFISENIISINRNGNKLLVEIEGDDSNEIIDSIKSTAEKYVNGTTLEKTLFENNVNFSEHEIYSNSIKKLTEGSVVLNDRAIFLFNFFDKKFEYFAHSLGAIDKIYPVLLPVNAYSKTGYLRRTPQYSMFCSSVNENLTELNELDKYIQDGRVSKILKVPKLALSPSACFHTYLEYENTIISGKKVVTFVQNVFRNEGRFNYSEIGRLMDYHVREVVILGSPEDVHKFRENMLEIIKNFLLTLKLDAKIVVAADPFVIPKMQDYKKIQIIDASKYELKASVTKNKMIALASFNLHGKAFTDPFNIQIKDVDAVSACVGFGIERWVIAFVGQYGLDVDAWPNYIKESYYGC